MKKKKLLIIIVIIIVVILGIGGVAKKKLSNTAVLSSKTTVEKVEKKDLAESISATGTFASNDRADVSTLLSGVKVVDVNVEVGDVVSEGQVLCTFDVDAAKSGLSDAKSDLSKQQSANSSNVKNAQNAYDMAKETEKYQVESAKQDKDAAKDAFDAAEEAYDLAVENEKELKTSLDTAKASLDAMQPTDEGYETAASKYAELSESYAKVKESIPSLESAKKQAENAYNKAKSAYSYVKKAQNSSVKSAKETLDSAKSGSSTSSANAQIRSYEQTVENGTLKAPMNGTVTSVNVSEDGIYAGGTVVTIQNTKDLYITTEIDEGDISKVYDGMKVLIKTDATGDDELEGHVKKIAPTATVATDVAMGGTASTSSNVTYEVQIELEKANVACRIDMTAKISLIVEERSDVLAVPYDAILQDGDGKRYVKVVVRDEKNEENYTTKDVYVNVGIESGYYAQISGEGITEGTEVEIESSGSSLEDIFNGMNAAGGM